MLILAVNLQCPQEREGGEGKGGCAVNVTPTCPLKPDQHLDYLGTNSILSERNSSRVTL
jgi:hypothetical protein